MPTMYKFSAASENEPIVFGSAHPGYSNEKVNKWIEFMQSQEIERVCCLLPESQLDRYSNLLEVYRQALIRCVSPIINCFEQLNTFEDNGRRFILSPCQS
jgi:hypothetical protein